MAGMDKAALVVGGVTLLDRVLAAAQPVCDDVVVVGPPRPPPVRYVTEALPGGGPVPAVAAGLAAVDAGCDVVVVLAVDLPLVRADDLRRLVAALDDPAVEAAAADDVGGPNPLLAAYRAAPLRARVAALGPGARAARLLPADAATVDLGPATLNVNRPEDLAAAERQVGGAD
jgi:molybdopterin-guanine dinucleotide biosynthesis protein A